MRNAFLGEALAASNQRCYRYINILTASDRANNELFGSISTVLGGLGAIFTPANTARALAGAAGISSGLQGDFNSAAFYGQTMQAISKAIQNARQTDFTNIKNLMTQDYADAPYSMLYPYVESYHDKCSLHAAFAEISATLARASTATGTLLVEQYSADQAAASAFQAYRNALTSKGTVTPQTVTTKTETSTTSGTTVTPAPAAPPAVVH